MNPKLMACTFKVDLYGKGCKRKRNTLRRSLKINQIYLTIAPQRFLGSLVAHLHSDLKIQNGECNMGTK